MEKIMKGVHMIYIGLIILIIVLLIKSSEYKNELEILKNRNRELEKELKRIL